MPSPISQLLMKSMLLIKEHVNYQSFIITAMNLMPPLISSKLLNNLETQIYRFSVMTEKQPETRLL